MIDVWGWGSHSRERAASTEELIVTEQVCSLYSLLTVLESELKQFPVAFKCVLF